MSKTRNISDLLDANGDVKSTALDNVPASNDASALTTGTLPNARLSAVPNSALANSSITINGSATSLGGSATISTDVVDDTSPQLGGNLDSNGNTINMADNNQINFGNSTDGRIVHNGTDFIIQDLGTGDLKLVGDQVRITDGSGAENKAVFTSNGSADLYYDNSKKLETTTNGVTVNGYVLAQGSTVGFAGDDNVKVQLGNSGDFQIYHSGSNSYINDVGTGNLIIGADSNLSIMNSANNKVSGRFRPDTSVSLYYNGSEKIATSSTGATITGDLSVTGSISGAGKVGQVVNTHTGNRTTFTMPNTNNATIITDLSTSITPSSTSSKILIQIMITHDAAWDGVYRLFRNSTDIGRNSASTSRWSGFATIPYDADQNSTPTTQMLQYLDSPSTTSSVQYKIGVQSSLGSNETFYFNRPAGSTGQDTQEIGTSNMILMEILP
jgi:hypothetical protein